MITFFFSTNTNNFLFPKHTVGIIKIQYKQNAIITMAHFETSGTAILMPLNQTMLLCVKPLNLRA